MPTQLQVAEADLRFLLTVLDTLGDHLPTLTQPMQERLAAIKRTYTRVEGALYVVKAGGVKSVARYVGARFFDAITGVEVSSIDNVLNRLDDVNRG